jgi:hypothetical protein
MRRLFYIFALALGALTACNQENQVQLEPLALTMDNIKWLTKVTDVPNENCALNEINADGQGYRPSGISGSDGGLTYDINLTRNTGITTAESVGAGWKTVKGLLGTPQRDATLLIVDDFHGVYRPKPALFTRPFQPGLNGATIASLQDGGNLSHGALVLQHAKDVIFGTGLYPDPPIPSLWGNITVYRNLQLTRKLTVKALDPGFEATSNIAGSIKSSVIAQKLLSELHRAGPSFVVNLSFVLIPCAAYADFHSWDQTTPTVDEPFEEYLKALALHNNVPYDDLITVIVEAVNEPNNDPTQPDDPLFTLIQDYADVGVFVAASGNYGFAKTGMYPAMWKGVVNVTGSAALDTNIRNKRFNTGKIMDIAASFRLAASRFTNNHNRKDVYYLGTSFSSPTVSAYSVIKSKLATSESNIVDVPLQKAVITLCKP